MIIRWSSTAVLLAAAAAAVQDILGRLNDRHVLIERARLLQASASPPALAAHEDLESLVSSLETECRRLHAQYRRDRATLTMVADRMSGAPPVATSIRRRVAG
jgi:hypothetical protein